MSLHLHWGPKYDVLTLGLQSLAGVQEQTVHALGEEAVEYGKFDANAVWLHLLKQIPEGFALGYISVHERSRGLGLEPAPIPAPIGGTYGMGSV